ncbi:MAG: HAD-IC family P-type ATPase [Patescibacteria group bacterium]|jgi:Ca2+-transporting ATPase
MDWHAREIHEIFTKFKTAESGLSFDEAKKRLEKYGSNKLPEAKRLTNSRIFFNQLKNSLVYVLLFAAGITIILREFMDTGIILAAVFLNVFIGFFEERKAEKTIEKLKEVIDHKARVLRDGLEREIGAEEVVPGDVIVIEAGDKIPADARLFKVTNLEIVEAALTGEAVPSIKSVKELVPGTVLAERENMVYCGTNVVRGRGLAVVVATGKEMEIGKIALMLGSAPEEQTPLQKKLASFARRLSVVLLSICFVIFIIGLLQGRSFVEMLTVAVAAAVAAVPEGLIVTVTVILAIGMQKILKEKALVRKLVAAETLGSTSIICTDKTGTLTLGKMMVDHIFTETGSEETKTKILEMGLLCNNAVIENPEDKLEDWIIFGDSTEQALLLAAVQGGVDQKEIRKVFPRLWEIPFDEGRKYMATLHEIKNSKSKINNLIYVKGAPEKVLAMSGWLEINGKTEKLTHEKVKKIKKEVDDLAGKGLRILAFAHKNTAQEKIDESDLSEMIFVGFLALRDPLRKESAQAIKMCREAGIRPILVTGDHRLTAQMVAGEIGLDIGEKNILEGEDLDKMSDEEFVKILKNIDVYARVEPRHKMRIIEAWQKKGEVVAMTGDGVNDAPALKKADVGVALGSGTEVAKEAADIILLDDNFNSIVKAVERGRIIFENIKKVILYLFSDIFTEMALIVASLFFGFPLPILAAQILWINLIEDSPPSMALAFDAGEGGGMQSRPRRRDEPIVDLEMKIIITVISLFTISVLFGFFYYFWRITGDLDYTRTMVFVGLGIDSLFYVYACRTLRHPLWGNSPFQNKFLNASVLLGLLMLALALYTPFFQKILKTVPLGINEWLLLIGFGIINILLIEVVKYIFITRRKKTSMRVVDESANL